MATKKKTASTKVSTSVAELHDEFDSKAKARMPKLNAGSKLLGKQAEGTARTLITTPVLTNRPVNVYIERVTDHATGELNYWLWHTSEQKGYTGKVNLVELNNQTLQEVFQGEEWDIEYTPQNAAKIAAESFGKTGFYFKDGGSRSGLTREQFLNFKPKQS